MPAVHGSDTHLMINSVDLSTFADTTDFDEVSDAHDTTTYGRNARTYAPGLKDATFSVGGVYDMAAGGPEMTIRPLIGGPAVPFVLGPAGSTTGLRRHTGSVLVKRYRTSHPVGEMVRWTADLQATGEITDDTFV